MANIVTTDRGTKSTAKSQHIAWRSMHNAVANDDHMSVPTRPSLFSSHSHTDKKEPVEGERNIASGKGV